MTLKAKIEAALFASGKALKINEISEILNASNEEVEENLLELIMDYASRDGALEIDDEDGYIIQVKEEYSDIVETLVPAEIPDSILKTLSAIAIKEPLLQSSLINIRGMGAYDHINYLHEKELITKKPKGKSYILKTTTKFKEYFKLTGDTDAIAQILDKQSRN